MMERIKYEKSKKGFLGFLVWWQSLDGRMQIKYYSNYPGACNHYKHLESLGRKPQIWRRVKMQGEKP